MNLISIDMLLGRPVLDGTKLGDQLIKKLSIHRFFMHLRDSLVVMTTHCSRWSHVSISPSIWITQWRTEEESVNIWDEGAIKWGLIWTPVQVRQSAQVMDVQSEEMMTDNMGWRPGMRGKSLQCGLNKENYATLKVVMISSTSRMLCPTWYDSEDDNFRAMHALSWGRLQRCPNVISPITLQRTAYHSPHPSHFHNAGQMAESVIASDLEPDTWP